MKLPVLTQQQIEDEFERLNTFERVQIIIEPDVHAVSLYTYKIIDGENEFRTEKIPDKLTRTEVIQLFLTARGEKQMFKLVKYI